QNQETQMKRADVTEKILTAKRLKELTWEEIAKKIGGASKIVVTAACMGQMKMTKEQATKAAKLFGLGKEETLLLQEVPYRGSLPEVPPTDPLIYRFYELVMVYGTTWKELIQEEFGDGIMSAIDFDMSLERQPDQKGNRVKIGMSGKFLAYKTYAAANIAPAFLSTRKAHDRSTSFVGLDRQRQDIVIHRRCADVAAVWGSPDDAADAIKLNDLFSRGRVAIHQQHLAASVDAADRHFVDGV